MAFDPDKYLQQVKGESQQPTTSTPTSTEKSFNPDEYLSTVKSQPTIGSDFEDLYRGGLQGATLGFGDELSGAVSATGKLPGVLTGNNSWDDVVAQYKATRDTERVANEEAQKRSPWLYGGGELAGGLALPIPGVGLFKAATATEKASMPLLRRLLTREITLDKDAAVLNRLAQQAGRGAQKTVEGALTGAEYGALYGAGKSEGDLVDDTLNSTAQGATIGGAIPGAIGATKFGGELLVKPAFKYFKNLKTAGEAFNRGLEGINLQDIAPHAAKLKSLVEEYAGAGLSRESQLIQEYTQLLADKKINLTEYGQKIRQIAEEAKAKSLNPEARASIDKVVGDITNYTEGVMQDTLPGKIAKISSKEQIESDLALQKAKLEKMGYEAETHVIPGTDELGRNILIPKLTYRKGDQVGELYDDAGKILTENPELAEQTKILKPKVDIPAQQREGGGLVTGPQAKSLQSELYNITQDNAMRPEGKTFASDARNELAPILEEQIPGLQEHNTKYRAIKQFMDQNNLAKENLEANVLTGGRELPKSVAEAIQNNLLLSLEKDKKGNFTSELINRSLDNLERSGYNVSELRAKIPNIIKDYILAHHLSEVSHGNPVSAVGVVTGELGGISKIVGKGANAVGLGIHALGNVVQSVPGVNNVVSSAPSVDRITNMITKGRIITGDEDYSPDNISKLSTTVSNMSTDQAMGLAQEMKMQPGMETDGEALEKALQNPNSIARNARIFSILSKKGGRELVRKYLSK